jgi:hypothetical protein
VGNLKGRVDRLEGGWQERGFEIIIVYPGESREEVMQKHPEGGEDELRIILNLSDSGQDSPVYPPPPRPEPKYRAQVPGPGPLQITR